MDDNDKEQSIGRNKNALVEKTKETHTNVYIEMNGNSNVPHSDIERENKIETLKHGSRIRPTRKYNSISSPRSTNDIIVRLLTVARVLSAVPLFIFVMLLVWKKKIIINNFGSMLKQTLLPSPFE